MAMPRNEVKDFLRQVRAKVAEGWCQNAMAVDGEGKEVHICDPRAVRVCLVTAIYQTVPESAIANVYRPIMQVTGIVKEFQLLNWNNDPDRTQEQVLSMLDRAILKVDE